MRNVLPPSREEIIETEHILSIRQQAFAQMRTNESGPASDKYSQDIWEKCLGTLHDSAAANIGKQVSPVNNRSQVLRVKPSGWSSSRKNQAEACTLNALNPTSHFFP